MYENVVNQHFHFHFEAVTTIKSMKSEIPSLTSKQKHFF